ncbi:MAG: glycosyltransferase family 61 protein [Rhodomicrobium sp.]
MARSRKNFGLVMVFLGYKGRIHRGKFTARSIRYILTDQAARLFPALRRRWLLPVESQPIAEAASADIPFPSIVIDTPTPACFAKLGIVHPRPVQQTHNVYFIEDVTVTGWAGAMIKNDLLLTTRPQHNWVSGLRARPHRIRKLSASQPYFNLMVPIPARGHIFHWLFDSILPFISFLESGESPGKPGLLVNAAQSEIQKLTIGFLKHRYWITAIEAISEREAVQVPHLQAAIPTYNCPRGLQSPLGLAVIEELGRFIAGEVSSGEGPKRIYISRHDAKLRRVQNEEELIPELTARGFERLTLAGMPLSQQVTLFLNAEAVVGPHGAAFAHVAWCRPGTKVIEFLPSPERGRRKTRPLANSDFWFVALQRNLSHSCYVAGQVEGGSDGFAIPKSLLMDALDEAGLR